MLLMHFCLHCCLLQGLKLLRGQEQQPEQQAGLQAAATSQEYQQPPSSMEQTSGCFYSDGEDSDSSSESGGPAAAAAAPVDGYHRVMRRLSIRAKEAADELLSRMHDGSDSKGAVFCPLTEAIVGWDLGCERWRVLEILLKKGLAAQGVRGNEAPLKAAVRKGYIELVEPLMDRGADLREVIRQDPLGLSLTCGRRDRYDRDPLGREEVVKLLLQHGAEVNAAGYDVVDCDRPAEAAPKAGNWGVLEILLKHGAAVWWKGAALPVLFHVAIKGQLQLVKQVLAQGIAAAAGVDYLGLPLLAAAAAGHVGVVKELVGVELNADWRLADWVKALTQALLQAAARGDVKVAEALVQAGADVRWRNASGWGPLQVLPSGVLNAADAAFAAHMQGRPSWATSLPSRVSVADAAVTAERLAEAAAKRGAVAALLLEQGAAAADLWQGLKACCAEPEGVDIDVWYSSFLRALSARTAAWVQGGPRQWLERGLILAAAEGNLELVQQLVGAGVDTRYCDITPGAGKWTPLLAAASGAVGARAAWKAIKEGRAAPNAAERAAVVTFLLEHGADPSACCSTASRAGTPLYIAVVSPGCSAAVVKALLGTGAGAHVVDLRAPVLGAPRPLQAARDAEMVELLLKAGAMPWDGEDGAEAPLLLAAERGDVASVQLLLGAGRLPGACVDKRALGERALQVAAREGHGEVVKVLLGAGAVVKDEGDGGATPLKLAMKHRNTEKYREAIKILEEADMQG